MSTDLPDCVLPGLLLRLLMTTMTTLKHGNDEEDKDDEDVFGKSSLSFVTNFSERQL